MTACNHRSGSSEIIVVDVQLIENGIKTSKPFYISSENELINSQKEEIIEGIVDGELTKETLGISIKGSCVKIDKEYFEISLSPLKIIRVGKLGYLSTGDRAPLIDKIEYSEKLYLKINEPLLVGSSKSTITIDGITTANSRELYIEIHKM
jgi:hypothetical protein